MKTCVVCRESKEISDFHQGHHQCRKCYNKTKNRNKRSSMTEDDKVKLAAYFRNYDKARREEKTAANRRRRELNREKYRPILNAAKMKRICDKNKRTPRWADLEAIKEIYKDASEFRAAGLDVHVDHIIPLRAKLASGLHVHTNLTIKLANWNDSKGNKFDPEGFDLTAPPPRGTIEVR